MSFRHFTRKLFGLSKSKEIASQRPHSSQMPNKSRSRSKTPLRADDDNSPLWPRFYNRLVRKQNPNMSDEDVKHYADLRVRWRKQDREKKRARENASWRPPSFQNVGLQMPIPLKAEEGNSPLWRRIFEKRVRNADPHMNEQAVKKEVDKLVNMRRSKRGGKKKSRRKSRKLLSFLN
jgi:hypothetical protein